MLIYMYMALFNTIILNTLLLFAVLADYLVKPVDASIDMFGAFDSHGHYGDDAMSQCPFVGLSVVRFHVFIFAGDPVEFTTEGVCIFFEFVIPTTVAGVADLHFRRDTLDVGDVYIQTHT